MKSIENLETKITELEYRLSILEKFLDSPFSEMYKDESTINSSRIEVMRKMREEGFKTEKFEKIWGTKFYRKIGIESNE